MCSSTAVPVDAGTLLLTCEAASKTGCGGRSISSLNGDLGQMVVFFDPLLRLTVALFLTAVLFVWSRYDPFSHPPPGSQNLAYVHLRSGGLGGATLPPSANTVAFATTIASMTPLAS